MLSLSEQLASGRAIGADWQKKSCESEAAIRN
jgi:hypothetical protein